MRVAKVKSSSLCDSAHRVAVMAVVIGCHLGLLMLLLRPATYGRSTVRMARSNPLVLKLHSIRPSRPTFTPLALPALRPVTSTTQRIQRTPSEPLPAERVTPVAAPPVETHSANTTIAPNQYTGNGDGGFQKRLHNAQHSHAVHGVPGAETPFAPGIRLIDPMSQGIGAVMRKTQRLFGVTNRRCLDVAVWRDLTRKESSARHISPDDLDKTDEKYDCNRPLGLSF